VRNEGVTLVASGEFRLLHHLGVVLHAFTAGVSVSELERIASENQIETTMYANFLRDFSG
jgi:hypothetical protein